MISPWLIYFIGIADRVSGVFALITVVLCICCVILFIGFVEEQISINTLKKSFIAAVISGLIAVFTPSSKTVAAMVVIPPIVNNEQVQELPNNVLEFINEYLKDAKKSLKDKDV